MGALLYDKSESMKSLGVMLLMCQNAMMRGVEHGLGFYVLCSKHVVHLAALFWFPAGSRRAARGAHICETPLLTDSIPRMISGVSQRYHVHTNTNENERYP